MSENEFHVCLLSNSSTNIYDKNTLSAFTNLLCKPLKLDDTWCVGLTEFSFNNFQQSTGKLILLQQDRESLSETDDFGIDDQVEVFKYSDRRKRKRATPTNSVEINVGNNSKITLKSDELMDISYNKKKLDINFGRFLEVLTDNIFPDWFENSEEIRKEIKDSIFRKLKSTDWTKIPLVKRIQGKKEFLLHVYMGSSNSNNVVLKYGKYELDEFLEEIISQIPISERTYTKMHNLFNIFFAKYKKGIDNDDDIIKKPGILNVDFEEYGVNLSTDISKINEKNLGLSTLINHMADNIEFTDPNITENEKIRLKGKLKAAVLDTLRGNDLNQTHISKQLKDDDVILNVPYNADSSYSTVLEVKTYNRLEELLNGIYAQIPIKLRNKDIFVKTLENALEERQKINDEQRTARAPKSESITVSTDMMYIYIDIIQPRHLGDTSARFLRILPTTPDGNDIEFKHVEYCPIEPSHIESISILITDSSGKNINFMPSTKPTYLMLHFKKKTL